MKKNITRALFLIWAGILLTAFYVVQKPEFQAFTGLADTIWTLLVAALLVFNAYGIGIKILKLAGWDSTDMSSRLLLAVGIGLGSLGILGFFFSILQAAHPPVLILAQFALTTLLLVTNAHTEFLKDIKSLAWDLNHYLSSFHPLAKIAVILIPVFSFLLALLPPFEAFDGLFYHLTQPARLLQDGGLELIDIPHFWFPNIPSHTYLWALAFHSEGAVQLVHYTWGAISALLLWHWAARTWNIEVGRKTILLLVSIPSLPLLASWAYADMALCFYAAASLFTLTQFKTSPADSWLRIMGVLCGFAMGVKYTSFVVPLACGLLLLSHRPLKQGLRNAAHFSLIALLTALPWYLRNAFLMGNPFYPFVFGGRYWDTFLAQWYSGSGTGIGWDIFQLILLPFNAVLGYRDANFFDGRMGPLFLILFPITLWILIKRPFQNPAQNWPLISITLFSALSFLAWTVGVINSSALWQTRLLFPALLPFAIPTALGWDALTKLDSPKLRVSFLVNALIAVVIALAIFDVGLFVFRRNPLAVVFGAQSREEYIHRVNPSYAELMQLMEKLPATALVYSLYEPRSYNLPRLTQPDAIVSNFAHDLFLYQTTDEVVQAWKAQGYTHILIYERGADLTLADDPSRLAELNYTRDSLILLSRTPDGVYSIYLIP